ncbi:MAG: hypothetical protein IKH42_02990 [Lachnospiraceae bacterium]|nr:hypothetical protein [Lachnospiraceae bacterium]MBR4541539.1 hypothetical protein [Lachnospiraceae bacterium]
MMKTVLKRLFAMLLVAGMICAFAVPKDVQAASSTKKKLKALVNCMSGYEWYLLMSNDIEEGEVREVPMSKVVMAKAAAFNCPRTYVSEYGEWEWEILYTVSTKKLKAMAKKMFGTAVTYKELPKMSTEDVIGVMDVYRNEKGKVELYAWEGETETAFDTIKISYKKSGTGYKITKDMFCGYWGIHEYYKHKKANYRIVYTVEKNKASSYGYVITGMSVEYLENLTIPYDDEGQG